MPATVILPLGNGAIAQCILGDLLVVSYTKAIPLVIKSLPKAEGEAG
ncbi:MAG: hypothetical protein HC878_02455 [Leptolyngbyaceae cyanobacterium SL_5_14]|nr:hypothetical protein [Leptolyngbyaceae cyanobacterium SL_5_14]NJO66629.1 hypothetical protein [Leptolyngbyaceae cyanobacterium RM1_405_57]